MELSGDTREVLRRSQTTVAESAEKKKRRPRNPLRIWGLGAVALSLVCFAGLGLGLRLHLLQHSQLERGLSEWAASAPANYRYEVGGSLFMPMRYYRITVADGEIVGAERYAFFDQAYVPVNIGEVAPYTLDNLQSWAQAELAYQGDLAITSGYDRVFRYHLDPDWHFVSEFSVDGCGQGWLQILDAAYRHCKPRFYSIRNFETGTFSG